MQNGGKNANCPRCFICDVEIADDDDGYDIFCNGSGLYQLVNNVLKLNLDAIVSKSTLLCKNCFELLAELEGAENRCAEIRDTFRSSFAKTSQINGNEYAPFVVAGIACQTDYEDNATIRDNVNDGGDGCEKQDLKMKIALVSKRKRGRPTKPPARTRKRCDSPPPSSDDPLRNDDATAKTVETGVVTVAKSGRKSKEKRLKRDNTEEIERLETLILEARRTRSTARAITRKKMIEEETMKEELPDETIELNDNVAKEVTEEQKLDVSLHTDEVFVEEFNVNDTVIGGGDDDDDDDDDFEWKEDTAANSEDDSTNSADDSKGKENDRNEDDSQSADSKDGKKKTRKKKRKRGDRKGERAFMVPIHECQQCGKKWRTVTELKSHVASHSDVRPFVCEICGQAYKMKKALDIHIGMHNGIHPFVCSYCNKSFTQKVGLEKHLPIHTGVTRFQCDLCGKRFIHQKSFNIHKMTHTGEKNIHCPICKLAVFSQSHLKRHYRVHTGERPYGCTICGKKFAEKYNLNAHTKIHDPNSAGEGRRRCHTCPICGITYDRKHKMADHLSTAHCMWQQSSTIEFKQEDFYGVDMQQSQNQHHNMLPLQSQHSSAIQSAQTQQPQPAQLTQQQPFAPPRPQQQQQQQSVTTQSSQQAQQQTQIVAHPVQHHLHTVATHHQQQSTQLSPHPLQTHHTQNTGAAPHHLLVTQHQLQQSLQTHPAHHPVTPPPPLQPISSVFQVVLQPPSTLDPASSATVHHNRTHMNAVPTLMPVPTP